MKLIRVGTAVFIACCMAPLSACVPAPSSIPVSASAAASTPRQDTVGCREASSSTNELTKEVAAGLVGDDVRTCDNGNEGSIVVKEHWDDLLAVDGTALPAAVELFDTQTPAYCTEIESHTFFVLVEDEWYRARYVECNQDA